MDSVDAAFPVPDVRVFGSKLYAIYMDYDTLPFGEQMHLYCIQEMDEDFNVLREHLIPLQSYGTTLFYNIFRGVEAHINYGKSCEYYINNDTLFAVGEYIPRRKSDGTTPYSNPIYLYFKGNLNGETYADILSERDSPSRFSFKPNGEFYGFGSVDDPNTPQRERLQISRFDSEGRFLQGVHTEPVGDPFIVPWAPFGRVIDDRVYITYESVLPTSACLGQTAAIEVRDTALNLIKRFKIDECDFVSSGMPFAKSKDGSIYFQAVYKHNLRYLLLQKYTPDMELIWSKVYDQSNNIAYPLYILPAEDGGVVLLTFLGAGRLYVYKISPDGDIVKTIELPTGQAPSEPVLAPNPCTQMTRYIGSYEGEVVAQVFGIDGRPYGVLIARDRSFHTSALPPGTYCFALFAVENGALRPLQQQIVVKVAD